MQQKWICPKYGLRVEFEPIYQSFPGQLVPNELYRNQLEFQFR